MHYLISIILLVLSASVYASSSSKAITGQWEGLAKTATEVTRLTLHIEEKNHTLVASLSLPDIGVSEWPATKLSIRGNRVAVVLPSDSGPQQIALTLVDKQLIGTWKEKRFPLPSKLELTKMEGSRTTVERRVQIQGQAGQLGASIFIPQGQGPFPGVVFLHGSGPQPRDASRFAAQAFAKLGIASIIYDKRGVAESQGNWAGLGFNDLASDAVTVAAYLAEHPAVSSVGFWGHSQGGWLAPLAATQWDKSAFVITSAGPAVSPAREGEWGFIYPIQHHPEASQLIPIIRKIVATWHDGLRSGNWQNFDKLAAEYKRAPWFKESGLNSLLRRPGKQFKTDYLAFMDYEPIPTLQHLTVPMLAIFSSDDESIDSVESIQLLNQLAINGINLRVLNYPGYSHSMRKIGSGEQPLRFPNHPQDYFQLQAAFIKSAL